jgi:hypothetical protein
MLTNITSAPIPAQLQVIGAGGFVLADTGPITVDAANTVTEDVYAPSQLVHCRFVNASKSKVRADMATEDFTGDATYDDIVAAQ